MMYAWPTSLTDHSDLSRRISADDHHGEMATCPLHGCRVRSELVNGIWQWIHVDPRSSRPRFCKGFA